MAISDKQKELLSTLKPPVATTSDRLKELLGVSDSWISKNKKGLEALSVFVERKPHKPHKPHKKHSNAGKSTQKTLTTLKTLEFKGNTYKLNNFLPIRVISNEVFKHYTLPFPTEVFSNLDAYYTMQQRVLEHFFSEGSPNIPLLKDYVRGILETVQSSEEGDFLKSSQYIPKDVKHSLISLKYLLDSVPVLEPLDVPESALKEIQEAFSAFCPYPPTEEQIQCLYKIKLFALGDLPLAGEALIELDVWHCIDLIQSHRDSPYVRLTDPCQMANMMVYIIGGELLQKIYGERTRRLSGDELIVIAHRWFEAHPDGLLDIWENTLLALPEGAPLGSP